MIPFRVYLVITGVKIGCSQVKFWDFETSFFLNRFMESSEVKVREMFNVNFDSIKSGYSEARCKGQQ